MRCEALRARDGEIERLTTETGALSHRVVEQEREIAEARSELAGARLRADEELRSLTVLGRQLEELRVNARGQATRIRLRALREAAELNARLIDASTSEGAEAPERERVFDALEDAIDRVAGDWEADGPLAAPGALALTTIPVVDVSNGASPPAPARAYGNGNGGRRRVSVDVGPFEDFSQLVRFEDAANAIGATGDISIKRFSEGRARIDVALSEPIDLLHELEERCDLEFKVRSSSDDEIVLDVDG